MYSVTLQSYTAMGLGQIFTIPAIYCARITGKSMRVSIGGGCVAGGGTGAKLSTPELSCLLCPG